MCVQVVIISVPFVGPGNNVLHFYGVFRSRIVDGGSIVLYCNEYQKHKTVVNYTRNLIMMQDIRWYGRTSCTENISHAYFSRNPSRSSLLGILHILWAFAIK